MEDPSGDWSSIDFRLFSQNRWAAVRALAVMDFS